MVKQVKLFSRILKVIRDYGLSIVLGLIPLLVVALEIKMAPYYFVLIFVLFLFEPNKITNLKKYSHILKPFGFMVLIYVLTTLISVDIPHSLKLLERQVSLVLLPIIICAMNWNKKRVLTFGKIFVGSLVIYSLAAFIYLIWFYFQNQQWIENSQPLDVSTYLQFKFPHLLGAHPTYLSYLVALGNLIILSNFFFHFVKKSILLYFSILFLNGTLLFLSARTPLLVNGIVHIMALIIYYKTQHKIEYKVFFSLILVAVLIGFLALPRMTLFIEKMNNISLDERMYLWPVAVKQIKANSFLWGEGPRIGERALKEVIIKHGDTRVHYSSFDLHNQYLMHYLDLGLVGVIALLYLIYHPLKIIKRNNKPTLFLLMAIVLIFGLTCLTETSFYRLKGIVIFSVFYPIALILAENNKHSGLQKA